MKWIGQPLAEIWPFEFFQTWGRRSVGHILLLTLISYTPLRYVERSVRGVKRNMLSWVELCRTVCTHPSAVVTQFPVLQPTRLDKFSTCSAFNPSTKSVVHYPTINLEVALLVRQFLIDWLSCEFNTHRRCDSTRQLSRVLVGGLYWALLGI